MDPMWKPLVFAVGLSAMTAIAEVKIEKTVYKGWADCYRITNGEIEAVVTGDIGPRIMRFGFAGGQNVFKEYEDQLGKSGEREYQLRGGHRLWVAPESLATSWALDNVPVKVTVKDGVLEATEPVEPATGVQKQIIVKMAPSGPHVEVIHRIYNHTPWTIELAPWAMSMMAQGGTEIVKFPPRGEHPRDLLPTNPLVMWAYTNLGDKRWGYFMKYFTLRQDPNNAVPQKIGMLNKETWAGYLLGSDLFVKRAAADPARAYPDFGCSLETFTNNEMIEIETLGALEKIAPGGYVEHIERWGLYKNVRISPWTEEAIDAALAAVNELK
jgi:hypothetical protein